MHRSPSAGARLATAALALLLLPAAAAHAALYVPTRAGDGTDGSCDERHCTLREAILAANASPGQDVVLLRAGTYPLSLPGSDDSGLAGDLDVTDDLILMGEGAAATTIDGGGLDRVLDVAPGAALEVRDLALRNGRAGGAGGGVRNAGELVIVRSLIAANRSAAGRGGGIASLGPDTRLTLRDSTLMHNEAEAGDGGALALGETANLANVTVAANVAAGRGGGLYVLANSDVRIDNATIAGNLAAEGGGLFAETSAFTGLPPRVANSILAGNAAASAPDCAAAVATSWSLVGVVTPLCLRPAGSHDLTGTAAAPLDAKLLPLQEVGGPTPTMPLQAGSPALDAASPATPGSADEEACQATDQRGVERPAGARCDIGAFEATTECVAGGPTLCLLDGRFQVRALFQTADGSSGTGHALPLTADSGTFWFFGPSNVEVTVKVLDGCAVNDRFWVFSAGMTNVRVDLEITDTVTRTTRIHHNPLGRVYRTRLDTTAFASCP